ncbi:acetyl-CoA acetyltransferase 2 [Helicobacter mustelae]|uniref:acetyl-CoA C-acetyltransferase n=1 Tax=Helicobacter mustelae TaxID=217 RepID=UPI000DF8C401|nr:acetyl-CoA C-acetyltransferase [Helicobacter mustelae]STP12973.1 acetyl-CoA acetyltransferase 2 [Helicobacter mustelae]
MEEVVIVAAKRSAIGSFLGSLKNLKATDLAKQLAKAILQSIKLDPHLIDEVILGQVLQSNQGQNPARQVLLEIGGLEKSAFMVNKVCGSGLKAVWLGYQAIALGDREVVLAGGVENMSLAPFLLENARSGYKLGNQTLIDAIIKDGLWCANTDVHMGITAENLAKKYNISRTEQDEFALSSQQKATKAIQEGRFQEEIAPISIQEKKGEFIFLQDEFVKQDSTIEALAKLKPAFLKEGSVSAGNASGINDGAAMLVLMSKTKAKELNLEILASLKAFASAGVEPSIMGIGAAVAAKKVMEKTGLQIKDFDLIEANEAFAAQSIACLKELGTKEEKVNVNGGAIALGHPIGASGARILVTLIHALRNQKKNLGLATLCIGGGQGISAVIEINE